jgi:hypothetical protein
VPVTIGEAMHGAASTCRRPTAREAQGAAGKPERRKLRLRGKGVPAMKGGARRSLRRLAGARAARRRRADAEAVQALEASYQESPRAGSRSDHVDQVSPLPEAAARLGCSPDFIERLEREG